jgi:EmrB/QacA subfamily drug resistance transporter
MHGGFENHTRRTRLVGISLWAAAQGWVFLMVEEQEKTTTREAVKPLGVDRKWWVLLAVGVGTFMSALDSSVANVILPVLNRTFGTNVTTVEWVVTIYLLVVSGLLLTFGRLGDLRSHKQIYILGFVIFVIGSALCGISPSIPAMVAFRALQALGAAMLFANSPAILTGNFPAAQRGQALGLQATMTYLGLTVGPSLGGWLTDQYSWRAVFFINVPIGVIAILLSLLFIPPEKEKKSAEPFDIPGALLFLAGLTALLLGLNQASEWGWGSPAVIALLALAVVFLGVFIRVESHKSSPMLDLSLFGRRLFAFSSASALMNYICLYSVIFLMPFYLIQGRGLSTGQAGLLLTAEPLIMAISAPLSGTLSDRIGSRLLSTLGMGIMAVGLFLLSGLNPASSTVYILLSLAVCGLGTGIFISPNTNALMGSAPKNRQGIASGVLATARNSGMVLGIGMAGAVFTTVQAVQVAGGATPSQALFFAISVSFTISAILAAGGIFISGARGQS